MKKISRLEQAINERKSLEDRFFAVVVMVGLAIVTVSELVTFIEDISYIANLGTAIGGVLLLLVVYEAYIRKQIDIARNLLCYAFNCVVIPITFFTCGGIDSGMPLYMLAGIFTIVPVLKGRHRIVCLIVSFITDLLCIVTSYFLTFAIRGTSYEELIPRLSTESRFIDAASSLILIGLYVVLTAALVMNAYQKEREKREELLAKLDELSKRDELTGLYNRREMFRFLEEMDVTEKHFLCMTDIDHFKNVNDTYGHVFGDVVLRRLAQIMLEEIRSGEGELAARYGGEEFLLVVKADSMEQAAERMDRIRRRFGEIHWEIDADLTTTFSGGLVACGDHKAYSEAISRADKRLYRAKKSGRNRVETEGEE